MLVVVENADKNLVSAIRSVAKLTNAKVSVKKSAKNSISPNISELKRRVNKVNLGKATMIPVSVDDLKKVRTLFENAKNNAQRDLIERELRVQV